MNRSLKTSETRKNYTVSTTILDGAQWPEITQWVQKQKINNTVEMSVSECQVLKKMFTIIDEISTKFMWYNCLEAPIVETLTETLKKLRTFAINKEVGEYIMAKQSSIFHILNKLLAPLFTKKNAPESCTKYLLHFYLNLLSTGEARSKETMRDVMFKKVEIQHFHSLFNNQYGHFYEVSALIYNLYFDTEIVDKDLVKHILHYHTNDTSTEYLTFLIEKMVLQNFVWDMYEDLELQDRQELLVCLCDKLIYPTHLELLTESCLACLGKLFIRCASVVFQVSEQDNAIAIKEVSYLLELLAHLSSLDRFRSYLTENGDILINAGVLLINVHMLGKQSENVFSPIQKLSEIQNPGEQVRGNPVFGFKADLVRLIGNLCWKNRRMQDLVRIGELIPVLLDCCNMDAKNPFIIQWVILAIRNICENNPDNQAVIAGLTQRGVVNSEVLQEFGFTLHTEENLSVGLLGLNINN